MVFGFLLSHIYFVYFILVLALWKHWTGFLQATYEPGLDWRWQTPPSPVDRQMGAWPSPPKARGRFRAGLQNGPLRWMRDRGPAATNRAPLFGAGAHRRGAAAVAGNEMHPSLSSRSCVNGVSVWMGFPLMMMPLSLHLSSILRLWRLRWCQTAGHQLCVWGPCAIRCLHCLRLQLKTPMARHWAGRGDLRPCMSYRQCLHIYSFVVIVCLAVMERSNLLQQTYRGTTAGLLCKWLPAPVGFFLLFIYFSKITDDEMGFMEM